MSQRDDLITLRQMIDRAREAMSLVGGQSREILDKDRVRALALVQLAQIVGEAARRISPSLRESHPEIEWAPNYRAAKSPHSRVRRDQPRHSLADSHGDFPRLISKLEAFFPDKPQLSEPR